MKKSRLILIGVILLAALVRLPFLGQFPNGFTGDEAQQGYSAYSILKTGHDEWGELLPLNPRGFGDYKPPLQTYLIIPSVALFDLNIWSSRLPAAILGVLMVLVIFYMTIELFGNQKIAIWSALLFAINPWSIQVSRTAWEGGIGIFTFSIGLIFFLKGMKRHQYLFPSAIFWGLTLYSYHSFRIFLALFLLGLLLILKNKIIQKKLILPTILLTIFALPLVFNLNQVLARSSDVGIFSEQVLEGYYKSRSANNLGSIDKLFDNKFSYVANIFSDNYFSYYSPQFFFTGQRPDNTYLNFPFFPLLYPFEIILWIIAAWVLITGKLQNRKIILLWLLLAAVPASLAVGSMNANRTPTFLPVTSIVSGIGLNFLADKLKRNWPFLFLPLILSFIFFLHFYFVQLPSKSIENLRYGYKQTFMKVLTLQHQFDEVVFSKVFTEGQIFIGFYGKMDPQIYQTASADWLRYEKADKRYVDQLESWNLGKYKFEDLNWSKKDSLRQNALVISKPEDFPESLSSLAEIKSLNGKTLYKIVSTNHE